MLSRLPRRLSRITEQLEDGTLSVNIRPLGDAADRNWIARVGSQLNLSLLGCALLFNLHELPLGADPVVVAGLVMLVFFTGYTSFYIPHMCLASEMTRSYDERTIRLNPEDLALITDRLRAEWTVVPDPSLPRGSLRVESVEGGIEDGPETWRRAIAEALGPC